MAEWSEEHVLAWSELVELAPEIKAALRAAFEEDETDGEDLATLAVKRLQKMLRKADLVGDLARSVSRANRALRRRRGKAGRTDQVGTRLRRRHVGASGPREALGLGEAIAVGAVGDGRGSGGRTLGTLYRQGTSERKEREKKTKHV